MNKTTETALTKMALSTEMKELSNYIVKCKTDIIKWMLIFWISQIGATLAIIMLVIKK